MTLSVSLLKSKRRQRALDTVFMSLPSITQLQWSVTTPRPTLPSWAKREMSQLIPRNPRGRQKGEGEAGFSSKSQLAPPLFVRARWREKSWIQDPLVL